jgi:hypothetical protein
MTYTNKTSFEIDQTVIEECWVGSLTLSENLPVASNVRFDMR